MMLQLRWLILYHDMRTNSTVKGNPASCRNGMLGSGT